MTKRDKEISSSKGVKWEKMLKVPQMGCNQIENCLDKIV
jgi:hypothetical protein